MQKLYIPGGLNNRALASFLLNTSNADCFETYLGAEGQTTTTTDFITFFKQIFANIMKKITGAGKSSSK